MEEALVAGATTGFGRLMNSEAPVIVVLAMLVIGLAYVSWKLYHKTEETIEARFAALEKDLLACRSQHVECERHTKVLAEAVLSAVKGEEEKAKMRAQFVLSKVITE